MPIHKKINKNFFKKWTHGMAYILGFLFADGNIICTKRKTWFWSIQITDKKILSIIKHEIESSHKISNRKKIKNNKQLFRLQIGSKDMCEDLIKLGLIERKSKKIEFPTVPDNYIGDFIRGYFDGDGGVWIGKNKKSHNVVIISFFTSGSRDFLSSLKGILSRKGIKGGCIVEKERGYDLKYSIKDSLILYKIMYNSKSPLFLKRKKDRFEKYIKMRS